MQHPENTIKKTPYPDISREEIKRSRAEMNGRTGALLPKPYLYQPREKGPLQELEMTMFYKTLARREIGLSTVETKPLTDGQLNLLNRQIQAVRAHYEATQENWKKFMGEIVREFKLNPDETP